MPNIVMRCFRMHMTKTVGVSFFFYEVINQICQCFESCHGCVVPFTSKDTSQSCSLQPFNLARRLWLDFSSGKLHPLSYFVVFVVVVVIGSQLRPFCASAQGFMAFTYLFYGYYNNMMVVEDSTISYSIPLAYIFTIAFYFVFCFIGIVARSVPHYLIFVFPEHLCFPPIRERLKQHVRARFLFLLLS